jgi:hypothetical protein
MPQRGLQPAQRPEPRHIVCNRFQSQIGILRRDIRDHADRRSHRFQILSNAHYQRLAVNDRARLVAPKPRTLAARENINRNFFHHDRRPQLYLPINDTFSPLKSIHRSNCGHVPLAALPLAASAGDL